MIPVRNAFAFFYAQVTIKEAEGNSQHDESQDRKTIKSQESNVDVIHDVGDVLQPCIDDLKPVDLEVQHANRFVTFLQDFSEPLNTTDSQLKSISLAELYTSSPSNRSRIGSSHPRKAWLFQCEFSQRNYIQPLYYTSAPCALEGSLIRRQHLDFIQMELQKSCSKYGMDNLQLQGKAIHQKVFLSIY